MKHKVLDHCIECNQLKRKIEEMANTIRFEAERANREQEQNKVLRDLLENAIFFLEQDGNNVSSYKQALKPVPDRIGWVWICTGCGYRLTNGEVTCSHCGCKARYEDNEDTTDERL